MQVVPNILGTVIVFSTLCILFYFIPGLIVNYEWRGEQSSNEKDKTASYELKRLREEYVGRAQRAFKSVRHSQEEVRSTQFLLNSKTLPLYETVVNENKWADVSGNGRVEINFNNVLMLFASYALTTGHENVRIQSMVSKAVLVVSSFLATVALSIVIGAMAQLHTVIKHSLKIPVSVKAISLINLHLCRINSEICTQAVDWILRINKSERNPNKLNYNFMMDVVKREAILLLITFVIASGGIVAGAAIMKHDQKDWSWSMALVYAQAAAFTSGHTKYIPDPIEENSCTLTYVLFLLSLHVWMITLLAMFLGCVISLLRSYYNAQWAEVSEEEFEQLEKMIEERRKQRQMDNPKYEE
ncbi:unnamed protein product [Enterobius vermicularis]|uniref:Ion_trans_2 domain-containing protein n=1 Tax=Enterobius vermicularis TaxID=51028 RepID=A0A0N4VE13_ENTVE|nr:unnamed protein product [Enterobius vermicularis]